MFLGFTRGLVLGEFTASPRLLSRTTVFLLATLVEKPASQKIAGYGIVSVIKHISVRDLFPLVVSVCSLSDIINNNIQQCISNVLLSIVIILL